MGLPATAGQSRGTGHQSADAGSGGWHPDCSGWPQCCSEKLHRLWQGPHQLSVSLLWGGLSKGEVATESGLLLLVYPLCRTVCVLLLKACICSMPHTCLTESCCVPCSTLNSRNLRHSLIWHQQDQRDLVRLLAQHAPWLNHSRSADVPVCTSLPAACVGALMLFDTCRHWHICYPL